jgi:ketosteroid isomerase-like protein
MDAGTIRGMLQQHFDHAASDPDRAHAMYTDDAVLEFPQSGERFEGVENFSVWRSNYPANTTFEFRQVRGGDNVWVAEISISYDGGTSMFGVSVIELRDEKIAHESIYVAEGFEPPEWRAKWRAAP